MNKSQILVTGLGQCGCILADEMKKKNQRYTTIYINSSLGDIKGLKYANNTNTLIYSGADGSGRDREKAKIFIENDMMRVATLLNKFKQFTTMLVFTSLDGGTGSGSVVSFIKLVKKLNPALKVNLVGVLPKLSEQDLQLKNTLKCCSELSEISELINDTKFINNNKLERCEYSQINNEAITDIDMAYGMLGHSEEGSIDEENLENVCTAQGYGVIFRLPSHYENIDEAFSKAEERSVFSIPTNFDCTYGAVNVIKGDYGLDRIISKLRADETIFKSYNNKYNIICLGGCESPTEDIEYIKLELEEREKNKSKNKRSRGLNFNYNTEIKKETPKEEINYFMDDDDIDVLLDPEKFRF